MEDDITAAFDRAVRAREAAAEQITRSAELSQEHASRLESLGHRERAELERARAAGAHDAVARARDRQTSS